MIEKTFTCPSCGDIHTVKLKEDYDEGDFMTVCPVTGAGIYVEVEE